MFGAFIGDIVGSKYEFDNIKTKQFPLFSEGCDYTDDSIMTVAMAEAILRCSRENRCTEADFRDVLVQTMQQFGRKYPHPTGAYGGRFADWLYQKNPQPYNSYGNGSAMRASPCGMIAVTLEEALCLGRVGADVTHNHPEGIKGAQATAAAVFFAKSGKSNAEIRQYIGEHFYPLDFTLDSIRAGYRFDVSCQGSVPQAIVAFLESDSFEDAIRNVISIGGDCDTTGAITGAIAWVYYATQSGDWYNETVDAAMQSIKNQAITYLPEEFITINRDFHALCCKRAGGVGKSI